MKSLTIACFLCIVAVAFGRSTSSSSSSAGGYTDRFDNLNLDEILGNRRLLVPYIKCVLDQGKCSAEGKELKAHIQEALEQNCAKCNDLQRRNARRVLSHLINNEPDYWNQLVNKYDPQRKFTARYEKELRALKG